MTLNAARPFSGAPVEQPTRVNSASGRPTRVFFDRGELSCLLRLYGRMVASGHWRDYAIEGREALAIFAVFRHASEVPLYRIEKQPALARRQGAYSAVARGGVILRRGHELARVLRVFDRASFHLVE